jgi:hypothetical protein
MWRTIEAAQRNGSASGRSVERPVVQTAGDARMGTTVIYADAATRKPLLRPFLGRCMNASA